ALHQSPPRRERAMLRQTIAVKSGDELEARWLANLFVNHLLRIIEPAAALDLAAEGGVSRFGRTLTLVRGLAHFGFGNPIADADDDAALFSANENHSQVMFRREGSAARCKPSGARRARCGRTAGSQFPSVAWARTPETPWHDKQVHRGIGDNAVDHPRQPRLVRQRRDIPGSDHKPRHHD